MNATTRMALLFLITAALGGGAYTQYAAMTQANTARTEARDRHADTQARAATLPAERQRQDTLLQSNAELQQTLPEREKLAALLRELRLGARQQGLNVSGVSRKADASPLPGVTAINLDLTVTGPYPALQAWLEALWRTDRALTIPSGRISAAEAGVEGELKIIAYARNVPVPAAPAATDASTPPTTPDADGGRTP